MKRFLITSPKFTGAAELIYDSLGTLMIIDLSNVVMAFDQIEYFNRKVPSNLNMAEYSIADAFPTATVIMADVEITFAMFWTTYNKKINRKRSEDLWNKMPHVEQVEAYIGIAPYDKYLKKERTST